MLIEPVEAGNGAGSFFWCGLSLPSVLVSLILVGSRCHLLLAGEGATFHDNLLRDNVEGGNPLWDLHLHEGGKPSTIVP